MNVITPKVIEGTKSDVKRLFDTLGELKLTLSDKQKSELISGLLENNVEKHVEGAVAPKVDSEPDLYVNDQPVEIKTTAGESWRGGTFSKRPGYYVFVSWKADADNNVEFFMSGVHMKKEDWKASTSDTYYATTYGKKELANNPQVAYFSGGLETYARGKQECVRVLYA